LLYFTRCRLEKDGKLNQGNSVPLEMPKSLNRNHSEEENMRTFRNAANVGLVFTAFTLLAGPVAASNVHSIKSQSSHSMAAVFANKHFAQRDAFGDSEDLFPGRGRGLKKFLKLSFENRNEDWLEGKIEDWIAKGPGRGKGLERIIKFAEHHKGNHGFEGIDNIGGDNGHHGGDVVPIPAAVWLMVSALSLLGWRGRKSIKGREPESA